jgi:hypothetical protein
MTAAATNIQAKEGSTWRTITAISAKEGGTWRTVEEVWVKDGGTWRHSWINSDPATYYWYASASQTFRENNNQRSVGYLYQGEGSGSSYGQQRSLILFDYSEIQSFLAVRPTILSNSLRISSQHWNNGDFNSTLGYCRVGGVSYSSIPSTWNGTEVYLYSGSAGINQLFSGGYAGARVQTKEMSAAISMGQAWRDGTIKGHSLYAHSTNLDYYGYFERHNATSSKKPRLQIYCDY